MSCFNKKQPPSSSSSNEVDDRHDERYDDIQIKKEYDDKSNDDSDEEDHESLPSSSPTLDISAYENLKVMELRALLRERKCSTIGRKVVLIRRLIAIYDAELQNLTTIQLRRKFKSKGMKQKCGELKHEMIQRLIEYGL